MNGEQSVVVIYNDSRSVPKEISAVTGVSSFGDVLRRGERLSTTMQRLAADAGLGPVLHARTTRELGALAEAARGHRDDRLYLLMPAHLAPTAAPEDAVLFLRKLAYLTEPVALWRDDTAVGACLLDRDRLVACLAEARTNAGELDRYVEEEISPELPAVEDALGLADLRELSVTLEFLSNAFSARHFNQVEQDRYHVVKRSHDREKIRREYSFYRFLPEAIQPYFVQPFDYREDADGASYRMRRLFVPDLAVQWVNSAFSPAQFEQLLAHLFHFLEARPRREVGQEAADEVAVGLYVDKVARRVEELLGHPVGEAVDSALASGGIGGVRAIHDRYLDAYSRLRRRTRNTELSVSHGDLCFSNILFSASTQTFHLIDPRGADRADEIYSDPYYDVAKLSHSVLGDYDFIVAGLFELTHRDDLTLSLEIEPAPGEEQRSQFGAALARSGFDYELVRVCEASLFLSMLPLHIDSPKRVTAFALRALEILDAVAPADGRRRP